MSKQLTAIVLILFLIACNSKLEEIAHDSTPSPSRVERSAAGDESQIWATLESRPLRLPSLSPGTICPASLPVQIGVATEVLGESPIYGVIGTIRIDPNTAIEEGGWYAFKTLWLSLTNYDGLALIRGRQLDGSNELRFGLGPNPEPDLRFPAGDTGVRGAGYGSARQLPSNPRVREPGCYAWQVDGPDFSYALFFEVIFETRHGVEP